MPGGDMLRLLFATILVLISTATARAGDVPLPADAAVTPPEAGVPANAAAFSGRWGNGRWDGNLDNILVVEKIQSSGDAQVVYAWGDYAPWHIKAGWVRHVAKIEGSVLHFALALDADPSKVWANVAYELKSDGTLAGTYTIVKTGRISLIVLHKL